MVLQAVARQIAACGSIPAKVDGPYGGASPLIDGNCEVAVIFAGGIGVRCKAQLPYRQCNACQCRKILGHSCADVQFISTWMVV